MKGGIWGVMKKKPSTRTGSERPTDKELIAHVREAPTTWVQFRAWAERFETPWEIVKPRINSLIDSGEFKRFAGGVQHADWVEPPNDEKDATETTESAPSVEPEVQGTTQEQADIESEKHSDPVPNVVLTSGGLPYLERILLDAIAAKPANAHQLAKRLDALPQQIKQAIRSLRNTGLIRRVGHSNGAVWAVGVPTRKKPLTIEKVLGLPKAQALAVLDGLRQQVEDSGREESTVTALHTCAVAIGEAFAAHQMGDAESLEKAAAKLKGAADGLVLSTQKRGAK